MRKGKILIIFLMTFLMLFAVNVKAEEKSCMSITNEHDCKYNQKFACVWNENKYGNYCNTDNLTYVYCGGAFDIPSQAPALFSFAVNLLKIATPIILIIVSIVTLLKALAASKEDEIKKAQSSLIKKLIAAALIFFIVSIVQFVMLTVADDSEAKDLSTCLSCFLNNKCEKNTYYKTNVAGSELCTPVNGGKPDFCKDNKTSNGGASSNSSSSSESSSKSANENGSSSSESHRGGGRSM